MIELARETWSEKRTAYNDPVVEVTWIEIEKLPRIHFHLYPHDTILELLVDWHGRGLVVAIHGGNTTYHFAATTWDEYAVIMKRYLKPVRREME